MHIPVSEAKGQLTDLVRRAEAGQEIVLTRHGKPAAKLVQPGSGSAASRRRRAIIEEAVALARGKAGRGPEAARSDAFLYDEGGLPA